MPEEEKKTEPMVDIDTSGPEVEVNREEDKKVEEPKETIQVEETEPKEEIKVEQEQEVKEETEDKKKELEDYSEGVQKRIAKLTKKWREAERQKEAAIDCNIHIRGENKDNLQCFSIGNPKVDKFSYLYYLKNKGKYLNFKKNDKIRKILNG